MPLTLDPNFLDPPIDPNAPPVDPNATDATAAALDSTAGHDPTTDLIADPGFGADPLGNTAVIASPTDQSNRTGGLPGATADGALLDQFPGAGFATGTVNPGDVAEPSIVAAANGANAQPGGGNGATGPAASAAGGPAALAAGDGWYVDAHGRFVSDNMGANARANTTFDHAVSLGPNTIIDLPGSRALETYGTGAGINTVGLGPQGRQLDTSGMIGSHLEQPGGGFTMAEGGGFTPPPGVINGGGAGRGLPGSEGATAPAAAGQPGSFQQEFQQHFGYYDPRFNSQANMEQNLLRGDAVIAPQAQYMAQFDPNLKTELAAIAARPDFYQSQNAAQWDALHNQQLTSRVAGGDLSLAAAQGQGVNVPAHPVDNAHALATQTMQDSLVKTLADLGATGFHQTYDPYGNATIDYTSANGKPQSIKASLVDYANALEQLRQNVAAQTAPPVAAGGGGYAPRAAAPPRGYAPSRPSGGYAPPAAGGAQGPGAAPTLAAQPGVGPAQADGFGYVSETGAGGQPGVFGNQPFNNAGKQAYPQITRPFDVPGGVNY